MLPLASSPRDMAAALARFDAALRASDSATRILQAWITERSGIEARVAAHVRALAMPQADMGIMARLGVGRWADVQYRRVWLTSGGRVFSIAENWYVPARLDSAMAERLSDGESPFGAVIAPLSPTRETLSTERLWDGAGGNIMPTTLLRHHALVRSGDGTPLCEVSETYTRNIVL